MLLKLGSSSLIERKYLVGLSVVLLAVPIALYLTLKVISYSAKTSFTRTITGVELIVGPKTSGLDLLFSTVFHLSEPKDALPFSAVQAVASHPQVSKVVPISLGDSYRGHRVVGTTKDFFTTYKYGRDLPLEMIQGEFFDAPKQIVIGEEIARKYDLKVGDQIAISHGIRDSGGNAHGKLPIVGILKRTHTPVDRAVLVDLITLEHLHNEDAPIESLSPNIVSAFYLKAKHPLYTLSLQRWITQSGVHPMVAVLPAVELSKLWKITGHVESLLEGISAIVLAVSLLSLILILTQGVELRKRELAILRSMGMGARGFFTLLIFENLLVATIAAVLGFASAIAIPALFGATAKELFGILVDLTPLWTLPWWHFLVVPLTAVIVGLVPAWTAYRNSVYDGLTPRS